MSSGVERMDDLDFNKLLQEAEQLTAEIEPYSDIPRVQRDFRQIYETGKQLLARASKDVSLANAETNATVFLGSRGIDITNMTKCLEPLYLSAVKPRPKPTVTEDITDIEGFLTNQRLDLMSKIDVATSKDYLDQVIESANKNIQIDWEDDKNFLQNEWAGELDDIHLEEYQLSFAGAEKASVLSSVELTYGNVIDQYNKAIIQGQTKPNLLDQFLTVARNSGDKNIEEMWLSVHEMIAGFTFPPTSGISASASLKEKRRNPRLHKILISRGKQYLERSYFEKLRAEVWDHVGKGGNLGAGAPQFLPMAKTYARLKNFVSMGGVEIGAGDAGPVWAIVYICLRSGKILDAAKFMRESLGNSDFAAILEEYAKGEGELPKELETRVKLEYRRVLRSTCQDPFKRIVYCVLGACDIPDGHPEVANRLDDYLWLKLAQVREDSSANTSSIGQSTPLSSKSSAQSQSAANTDVLTYSEFQDLISVKYGENYFNAFQQPYTYFQALFLTGQFEAAIGFFARMSLLRAQAVHLAIVLNELGILLVGSLDSRPVAPIEKGQGEGGMRSLNFYRLISTFVDTFDGANARVALNYLFALRNMKDDSRVSLFSVCVSNLAITSKDFAVFFGTVNEDGCRTPGVLDAMGIDIKPVAEYCATESENRGMLEDAVILHDLIGNHEAALKVLIAIMAANASSTNTREGSSRQRIQNLAISLAERYQTHPPNVSKAMLTSFYTLLDCMTFFDEFSSLHYENCITILEKIKIVPLEKEEVDKCVAKFESLAVEIRRCVPELILATVECLQARYKKLKAEKRGAFLAADSDMSQIVLLADIKSKCKALVTFCGLLPYYMNGDIYTRVMQVEVQMN